MKQAFHSEQSSSTQQPVFTVAAADEEEGAHGAEQLTVHEALEDVSTGATKLSAAAVDCRDKFLLFEWPIKQAPRLALPLFILLAGILHLSTIYLFNIVYQPPHVSKPVAAQVLFLLPNSRSSQQLAPWLAANDPSIFSPLKTVESMRPKAESTIYEPHQLPPALHPLPQQEEKKSELPLLPTDETILPRNAQLDVIASPAATPLVVSPLREQPTIVQLLDGLSERTPLSSTTLGHPEIPNTVTFPLPPTTLTVNIDAMGIPRHVIILQSSGNSLADEAASSWFMTRRFAPADHTTWGNVLIIWGSETRQQKIN